MGGLAILAGKGFLPGPFPSPEDAEGAVAGAVAEMIDDLVRIGFLFDGEVVDGDEFRSYYAVTDESLELLGIDIHRIIVWHGGGEEIPFGEAQMPSRLGIVFEECIDFPKGMKERAAALFGKYLCLDETPVFVYVYP